MRKLIRGSDRCVEQMPFIKPKADARLISKDRFSEIVFILPKENNVLKKLLMLFIDLYTALCFPTSYSVYEKVI